MAQAALVTVVVPLVPDALPDDPYAPPLPLLLELDRVGSEEYHCFTGDCASQDTSTVITFCDSWQSGTFAFRCLEEPRIDPLVLAPDLFVYFSWWGLVMGVCQGHASRWHTLTPPAEQKGFSIQAAHCAQTATCRKKRHNSSTANKKVIRDLGAAPSLSYVGDIPQDVTHLVQALRSRHLFLEDRWLRHQGHRTEAPCFFDSFQYFHEDVEVWTAELVLSASFLLDFLGVGPALPLPFCPRPRGLVSCTLCRASPPEDPRRAPRAALPVRLWATSSRPPWLSARVLFPSVLRSARLLAELASRSPCRCLPLLPVRPLRAVSCQIVLRHRRAAAQLAMSSLAREPRFLDCGG